MTESDQFQMLLNILETFGEREKINQTYYTTDFFLKYPRVH